MDKRAGLRDAPRKVLDDAARERRQKKALEILEKDNHIDDPSSDFKSAKRPKFDDEDDQIWSGKKTKKKRGFISKAKTKKTFEILLDEEFQATKGGQLGSNYFTAEAPKSRLPHRKFCSVCGFSSIYTCVICGIRYCSTRCRDIHVDTRCMKWVA